MEIYKGYKIKKIEFGFYEAENKKIKGNIYDKDLNKIKEEIDERI
jgi:hypothetical protein